jgi:hypothetical protein
MGFMDSIKDLIEEKIQLKLWKCYQGFNWKIYENWRLIEGQVEEF